MQSDSIRRRNNGTRDDVVTVHKRTSNWFTNSINVHRRSTDECDDETNRCGKQRWDHQNAEPTDIETVISRSNPGTEIVPEVSRIALSNSSSHFRKRVSMIQGELNKYSIPTPPSSVGMRDALLLMVSVAEG